MDRGGWKRALELGLEVLGGPLRAKFSATPPTWWKEKVLGYFVGVGNEAKGDIWSGNMIFDRAVIQKIGGFDPNVGPRQGKLLKGEDSYLMAKAKIQARVLFLRTAIVYHLVGPERLTLKYIINWAYNSGKSQKIAFGPKPVSVYVFLKALLEFFNPFLESGKTGRILRIAVLVEQAGAII